MTQQKTSSGQKQRYVYIDLLRGWAVLVMIEVHVVNAFLLPELRTPEWFKFLNFINGLVAPSFLFVSGFSFVLVAQRKWNDYLNRTPVFRKQLGRIFQILAVGYLLHLPYFSFSRLLYADWNEWGPFWNGQLKHFVLTSGYKISVPLALTFEFEQNRVELPDDAFLTRIYRSNIDILFNSDMALLNYLQYDSESQKIGWQSRFRWILTPGNEILFVFNSLWQDPHEQFHPQIKDIILSESTTQLKIDYNYRF